MNIKNDTASITMTCFRCGTESPFVPGVPKCPQCANTWYPISYTQTHCRNCGGYFPHSESPLCSSCGLHMQDLACRGCVESYRMTYPERTDYPCPHCGRENRERDFFIMDVPTIFEETEYITPYPLTSYPFDENTSPRLLQLLPSPNAPFERKMPFGKRVNQVDLNPALVGKWSVRNEDITLANLN